MKFLKLSLISTFALILAGCVDRSQYETEPVSVETDKGTVICQLYTDEFLVWDESIQRPSTMSRQEADAICQEMGAQTMNS